MADTLITSITPIEYGRTVFGNKRIVIADILLDGGTWPAAGIALAGSQFGMQALDAITFTGSSKVNYKWASNLLQAYASTGAGAVMGLATGIAVGETIRVTAIGYGLAP